jgi:hypothetical protein
MFVDVGTGTAVNQSFVVSAWGDIDQDGDVDVIGTTGVCVMLVLW